MAFHNFEQLCARMSPAANAAGAVEHRRLVEEMSLLQLREARELTQTDLEIRAVLPDGRAVKITQFSEESV